MTRPSETHLEVAAVFADGREDWTAQFWYGPLLSPAQRAAFLEDNMGPDDTRKAVSFLTSYRTISFSAEEELDSDTDLRPENPGVITPITEETDQ